MNRSAILAVLVLVLADNTIVICTSDNGGVGGYGHPGGLIRDPSAKLQRDAIFQHFPGYLGFGRGKWRATPVTSMQSGDWKLTEYPEDGTLELYNIRGDLGETKNFAAGYPSRPPPAALPSRL